MLTVQHFTFHISDKSIQLMQKWNFWNPMAKFDIDPVTTGSGVLFSSRCTFYHRERGILANFDQSRLFCRLPSELPALEMPFGGQF